LEFSRNHRRIWQRLTRQLPLPPVAQARSRGIAEIGPGSGFFRYASSPKQHDELKKPVGILNPQRLSGPNSRPPRKNAGLQHAASFYQNGVTWAQLQAAQFPPTMTDVTGAFHKPPTW